MGLTSSLYTSLAGMTTNSEAISVAGNNISNVNTTGFKASSARFETQISEAYSNGSPPQGDLGGTNPTQIGLGVRLGSVQRDFSNGSLQPTGVATDLAIEDGGFFIVDFDGKTRYTRAGNFNLDRDFNLVSPDGGRVQGYGVDDNHQLVQGAITGLKIPLGADTVAERTSEVKFKGNLNGGGDVATLPSVNTSEPLTDATTALAATAASLLTDLRDPGGAPIVVSGDVISVTGATKGGAAIPPHTFQVGAANTTDSDAFGTTAQDLMDFFQDILGIDPALGGGVVLDGTGQIVVTSNLGGADAVELEPSDIVVNAATTPVTAFDFTQTQDADGESVRTTFVAYDSLGQPMTMDMTLAMTAKSAAGTTWRFTVESEDDSDLSRAVGAGTLTFDTSGKLTASTNTSVTIDRIGTGAVSPQTITLVFDDSAGAMSALADANSRVSAFGQDGSAIGTLESFSIGKDGVITGTYSNGLLRTHGQIVLATFSNPLGLIETGSNQYDFTANSGLPTVNTPGNGGAGRIVGGALELSNVELSQEFINLITYSTGFSASSRVLTTSDRLIQELLSTVR